MIKGYISRYSVFSKAQATLHELQEELAFLKAPISRYRRGAPNHRNKVAGIFRHATTSNDLDKSRMSSPGTPSSKN